MLEDYKILSYKEVSDMDLTHEERAKIINVSNMNGDSMYLVPSNLVTREQKYDKLLEELLEEFDFDKVVRIMKLLDWTWYGEPNSPTIDAMKDCIKGLYESIKQNILKNVYCYSATGGFNLSFNPDEDQELKLVFEAVEYSVFGV